MKTISAETAAIVLLLFAVAVFAMGVSWFRTIEQMRNPSQGFFLEPYEKPSGIEGGYYQPHELTHQATVVVGCNCD